MCKYCSGKGAFNCYGIYMLMTAAISYINYFVDMSFRASGFGRLLGIIALLVLCIGFFDMRKKNYISAWSGIFFAVVMISEMLMPESICVLGDQLIKLFLCINAVFSVNSVCNCRSSIGKGLSVAIRITLGGYLLFSLVYLFFAEDGVQSALDLFALLGYVALALTGLLCVILTFSTDIETATVNIAEQTILTEPDVGNEQMGVPLGIYFILQPVIVFFLILLTANAAVTEQALQDCEHFANVAAGVVTVGLIYKSFNKTHHRELSLSKDGENRKSALALIFIYVCADFLLQHTASAFLEGYISFADANEYQAETILNGSVNWRIFHVVMIAPLVEEIVFRFGLFGGIRKKTGFWMAAIVSSVLFGMVHMNLAIGLSAFLLGIVSCVIYESTHKILFSISLHMIANLLSLSVSMIAVGGLPTLGEAGVNVVVFVCTAGVLIFAIYRYRKQDKENCMAAVKGE